MNANEKIVEVESPAVQRLDGVHLNEAARSQAKEHMRQSEAVVDLVAAALRSLGSALTGWSQRLFPSTDREREAYLSGAVDRVDLEHRIRVLERRPTAFLDGI